MFTPLIISIAALFIIHLLRSQENEKESPGLALRAYCQLECMGNKHTDSHATNFPTLNDPMPRSEEWGGLHG